MHHRLKLKDPKMNNQLGCEIHWVSLMTHHLSVALLFLGLKNAPYDMGHIIWAIWVVQPVMEFTRNGNKYIFSFV